LARFPADLSFGPHLLIGLGCVERGHGGRLSGVGAMGPLVVLEGDPASDTGPGL
jgi:hypothetical protein